MPLKPNLASWGNSFTAYGGKEVSQGNPLGEIDRDKLNATTVVDGVEFTHFEETLKDYIMARLGHPVVRVELTPFQIKTCMDEAVGTMYNHCLLYTSPSPRDRQKSRMPSSA